MEKMKSNMGGSTNPYEVSSKQTVESELDGRLEKTKLIETHIFGWSEIPQGHCERALSAVGESADPLLCITIGIDTNQKS
jgi:hypothetical protein